MTQCRVLVTVSLSSGEVFRGVFLNRPDRARLLSAVREASSASALTRLVGQLEKGQPVYPDCSNAIPDGTVCVETLYYFE